MKKEAVKYIKAVVNLIIAVVLLCVFIFLVPKVLIFFMPFVIGWVIALIANPLVRFFEERLKIRRKAGSAFVIIAVIAGIIIIGYLLVMKLAEELTGFAMTLPALVGSLEQDVMRISANWQTFFDKFKIGNGISVDGILKNLETYAGEIVSEIGTPTVAAVSSFAKNIPGIVIGVIMCVLSAYSFIAEKAVIGAFMKRHMPQAVQRNAAIVSHSIKYAIGGYFKAQLKIEIWIYLLMTIGLAILDINYAFLIAFGMAALDFLPFFGTSAVLVPWAIVKFLSADYKMAIGLLIIWAVGQLVRQLIQPKYVGDSIGLSIVPTLFMLFIGYKIAGVIGMIFAVPVAIIIVDMYKAGAFDTTKNSMIILITGINKFRKLNPEDLPETDSEEQSK